MCPCEGKVGCSRREFRAYSLQGEQVDNVVKGSLRRLSSVLSHRALTSRLAQPIFDLESRKLSKTIVIAHVSPFIQDAAHSANTLSYAAPFKSSPPSLNGPVAYDASDPRTWDSERTRDWLRSAFEEFGQKIERRVMVDVDKIVPNPMTAKNVARLYASEWFERCLGARVEGNEANMEDLQDVAMDVYEWLHYLLMKARTRRRKRQ